MYLLTASYAPGWRVYVPVNDANSSAHEYLKEHCMWGGKDKTAIVEGIEMWGYEFNTIEKATQAITWIEAHKNG